MQITSDFTLEEIVSIEGDGEEEVFDIQVEGTENFIANGVVSHNTRWNEDDLAGRIIKEQDKEGKDRFVHIDFPAIAEEDEEHRLKGEALWETKYDLPALQRIKANIGIYDWSALYQQQPTNREAQEFKQEWFKTGNAPGGCMIFTTVDPAISKKDKACNSVVMTCAVDGQNNIYILEYTRAKLNPSELIDEIWRHAGLYNPDRIGIEINAYQHAVQHYFEVKQEEEKQWYNIEPLTMKSEKDGRIRGLIPYYRNGKIYHNHFCSELEEELTKFPNGKFVDAVDALSLQLYILALPDLPKIEEQIPYANDPDAVWNKKESRGTANIYSLTNK